MDTIILGIMSFIGKLFKWNMPSTDNTVTEVPITSPAPQNATQDETLLWDTPQHAYHATRVTCDNLGLSVAEKNLICACIFQESRFDNNAKCFNRDKGGKIWSTDWGICQINDWFHVGPHKEFPSTNYIVNNPDKAVEWMIDMYKKGQLKQWVSYSSGAYRTWLDPSSSMWLLGKTS